MQRICQDFIEEVRYGQSDESVKRIRAATRRFSETRRAVPTDILHFPARVVVTPTDGPYVLEGLSGVRERPMIMSMRPKARPQQRYDHPLRNLVQRTGDVTVATDLGVPRSTAEWVQYFNAGRPQQGIGERIPSQPRLPDHTAPGGTIVARPVLGGLHHDYHRAA